MARIEVVSVKLSDIKPSRLNPRKRFDEEKLKELAASIKEKGLIEPIVVRPLTEGSKEVNGYEIVCGERRYRAAKLLEQPEILARIMILDATQALEYSVIENLQREDVHPLEEAEGYEQLLKTAGYKAVDDIAAKIGKSKSYVYGRMKLCDLIPDNRKLFYEGKFEASTALLVARVPAHLQKEAGAKVAKGEYASEGAMSYRKAVEYLRDNFMLQLKEAAFDPKDKTLGGKAGACVDCSKRTGNQKLLFPEISSADVCTDPACFAIKKNAHLQKTVDRLKKEGKKILSLAESKKLFPHEHSTDPQNTYESLDETCFAAPGYRKYRELIKGNKDVEIIYAVHPEKAQLIEMIAKKDVPAILKKAGVKTEQGSSGTARAEQKKTNRVVETRQRFWRGKLSGMKDRRCLNVALLYIALKEMGWSDGEDFAEELGLIKDGEWNAEKLYALGDEKVKELLDQAAVRRLQQMDVDDEDLEFICGKIGFDVAKDYVITEAYLQAMTKDELAKLDRELGIGGEEKSGWKKSDLVAFILKHAPKGKVPKELAKKG